MKNPSKPIRILVLDADLVPALTVVRSLVKQGYLVDIASAVEAPIASYSRRVADKWRYPDPLAGEAPFLTWLEAQLAARHYDLVIPVTERTLVPLSAHRHRFGATRIAMPDARSLNQVLDKAETCRLAESLDVAVPRSVCLSDIGQLASHASELTYPVVVKPSRSVAAAGSGYSTRSVSYAATGADLYRQCESALRHSPILLQSYCHGLGTGIELIARDGEILYPFQHLRLHETPLTGGGSSFRISTAVEPVLLAATRKLIQALNWTGVAMVEFKWNPQSGDYCLMEINGRFWGSLPLAAAAGADFPAMLAELCLTGAISEYPAYRPGVYCRNLGRDLMWHEMVLRHRGTQDNNALVQPPTVSAVMRDLGRCFSPKHHFDTQSFSDPLPGLVEIIRLAGQYRNRASGVISEKIFVRRQRHLWRNGTVGEKVRAANQVLFICYGNINRSAVAEVILTTLLPKGCQTRVLSAGFHHDNDRPADPTMQTVASEHGFDLSRFRSARITDALLAQSDVIFVMEKRQYDRLIDEHPAAADRTFLLGPGSREAGQGDAEIADPYHHEEEVYRACFAQVHQAVTQLKEKM